MPTFPFFPFYPNYYNRYYPHYHKNSGEFQNRNNIVNYQQEGEKGQEGSIVKDVNNNKEIRENLINNKKRTSKNNSFANINISALLDSEINTPIIELFGIKLYLDDLIIIGLLFFLYKEDVQDEILFGILLLLLLS